MRPAPIDGQTVITSSCSAAWLSLTCVVCTIFVSSGCVDEQRIRQAIEEGERRATSMYLSRKAADVRELRTASPCCDDLRQVRAVGQLSAGKPYGLTVGTWPNRRVIEMDSFRSFYALIALDGIADSKSRLSLQLTPSLTGMADPETRQPARELFVPVVTFLDSTRERIASETATPKTHTGRYELTASMAIPSGTAYVVLHSNKETINAPSLVGLVPSNTSAFPIGAGTIVARSPASTIVLLPSFSGTVSVSLE